MNEDQLASLEEIHSQVKRAKSIRKSLGVYTAARYLYLRGWSIDLALNILVYKWR